MVSPNAVTHSLNQHANANFSGARRAVENDAPPRCAVQDLRRTWYVDHGMPWLQSSTDRIVGYDWDFAIEECHPREQCIPCHDVLIVKFKEDSPAKSSPRKKRTSNGNTRQKPAAPPACPPCRKKDAPVWLRMSIVPELCFQDKDVDSQKRIVARSSVIFDQMVAPRKALLRALTQADVSDKREVRRFNEALIVYHMRWYLHENRHGDVNLGSKHRPQSYRMDDILARMQPRAAVVADSEDNLRDGLACFESCLSSIDPKPR